MNPINTTRIAAALGCLLLSNAAMSQQPRLPDGPASDAPATTVEIRQEGENAPALVREGAFLSGMQGELRRTELGWVMDFAPDQATGERLVSMVLQRGMTLSAMEQIIEAHSEPIGFVVSGQVFVYQGRNYLLPTRFAVTTNEEPANTQESSTAPSTGTPAPEGLPGFEDAEQEPSVDNLLGGFQQGSAGDQPLAPASAGSAMLREGKMIAQVRGRVLPGAGGDLVFTQDTDPDSDASDLPPMRLMPCLNVERLEKLRLEWGDRLVVQMSGRLFVDNGQPMLLPTMYIVDLERAGNLTLGQ